LQSINHQSPSYQKGQDGATKERAGKGGVYWGSLTSSTWEKGVENGRRGRPDKEPRTMHFGSDGGIEHREREKARNVPLRKDQLRGKSWVRVLTERRKTPGGGKKLVGKRSKGAKKILKGN